MATILECRRILQAQQTLIRQISRSLKRKLISLSFAKYFISNSLRLKEKFAGPVTACHEEAILLKVVA